MYLHGYFCLLSRVCNVCTKHLRENSASLDRTEYNKIRNPCIAIIKSLIVSNPYRLIEISIQLYIGISLIAYFLILFIELIDFSRSQKPLFSHRISVEKTLKTLIFSSFFIILLTMTTTQECQLTAPKDWEHWKEEFQLMAMIIDL